MDNYAEILADLKQKFVDQLRLSPADIASIIKQSTTAQAMMRGRGHFPIPFTKHGSRIYISIYDLARYLSFPEARNNAPAPLREAAPYKSKSKQRIIMPGSKRGVSLSKFLSEI